VSFALASPVGIILTVTEVQAAMTKRSTISSLCLLMSVLLNAAFAAQGDASSDQTDVLQRLLQSQRGVASMSGRFIQTTVRADDPTGGGTERHGHFDLQAPDKYNLVYTNPKDPEYRLRHCSDGVKAWQIEVIAEGEKPEVKASSAGGAAGEASGAAGEGRDDVNFARRITALLRGDREAVLKDFTVQGQALKEGFSLTLQPKPGPLAEHLTKVEAELDADTHVRVLRFFDHQGNRITITVNEATYNQPIPPEAFTYTGP
jgi:outer membrane lipoprotein-sorting protein